MQPIYVSKSLVTASSTGLGSVSSATPPVVTLNTSQLDTARRISLSATAAFNATFVLTGTREGGGKMVETVIGASVAGAVSSLQDFLTLSSVSVSSALGIPISIGTNTTGGTVWKVTDWTKNPMMLSMAVTFSSTANSMTASADFTLDDPTGTYSDPDNPGNLAPDVFTSTSIVSVTGPTLLPVAADAFGTGYPVAAWRLTITSSSSTAGTVYATVMQAG